MEGKLVKNFRVEKSKCSLSINNDFWKVKLGLPYDLRLTKFFSAKETCKNFRVEKSKCSLSISNYFWKVQLGLPYGRVEKLNQQQFSEGKNGFALRPQIDDFFQLRKLVKISGLKSQSVRYGLVMIFGR